MNAKITYHRAFSDTFELPTIDDVADYFSNALGLEYETVLVELTRLDTDERGGVDENLFFALYFKVGKEDQDGGSKESELSLCASKCARCMRLGLSKAFLCSKAKTLRSHCFDCHGVTIRFLPSQNTYSVVSIWMFLPESILQVYI